MSACGSCRASPDLVGELFLVATFAPHLPVKHDDEDQEGEDEERGPHNFAHDHSSAVRNCETKPAPKAEKSLLKDLFVQVLVVDSI